MVRKVDEVFEERDWRLRLKTSTFRLFVISLLVLLAVPLFVSSFTGAGLQERISYVAIFVAFLALIFQYETRYYDSWLLDTKGKHYYRKLRSSFNDDDYIFLNGILKMKLLLPTANLLDVYQADRTLFKRTELVKRALATERTWY